MNIVAVEQDPVRARSGTAVASTNHEPGGEGRTRDAVINLLLAEGPITAAALAERLRLSAAGIRRHLDVLVDEGAVSHREHVGPGRRGRGRPAKVYLLTDKGRDRLPHGYDALAAEALRFLAEHAGPEAVTAFARQRAETLVAARREEITAATDPAVKVSLLAGALTERGFAASAGKLGKGEQLCQHHCPVAHVAAEFPQLCEEEMAVFTEVLGTYAQRLATIARGDSFCTTYVPHLNSVEPGSGLPDPPPAVDPAVTD